MTDAERTRRIAELFEGALDRAPAERAAWLERACGDDEALRREVAELLEADASDARTFTPSGEAFAEALGGEHDPWIGRTLGVWTLEAARGEGGMGRVYQARRSGGDFTQHAAVKVLRAGLVSAEARRRFERERATLARLEHPGIARLLDGGTTDEGVPWLAMELVDGEPLDLWCDSRRLGVEARVELVARICDAVAYAHTRLVVHRDLKPSNVLVDTDGHPRLLDFGIAKVLDDEDAQGLTREGATPRTPGYASPEQIRGEPVGTASDVYSLGVLLHELLTGGSPHAAEDDSVPAMERAICETPAVRPSRSPSLDAPPRGATTERLRRRLAGDLDNIVLTALAKEPERRYASVAALADDLRRHLAGLPVAARAPTLAYRASRFFARHRVACVLALALVVVAAAAGTGAVASLRRDRDQLLSIRRLSDARRLDQLRAQADGPLWPPRPQARTSLDAWLGDARELVERLPEHAATLAALQGRIDAGTDDHEVLWWHEQLTALVAELEAFAADDPWGTTVASVARRRALVDEIERASLVDAAAAWASARAAIAVSPLYAGLDLPPQWGLVPWREDRGLWTFWVAGTGEPPRTGSDGRLLVDEATALVMVLVPGGSFSMGAQATDPNAPGHDPDAHGDEAPVHVVALGPFFLAATEMTQGQWARLTGRHPSHQQPPAYDVFPISLAHPVEQVSFEEAAEVLRRAGLRVPTEAQWEYAARAGTATPWWCGAEPSRLDGVANVADLHARDHHGSTGWNYEPAERHGLDDGFTVHAPVASYAPNPLGLYDVHGNVWEWTSDQPAPYWLETEPVRGARVIPDGAPDGDQRILRGGAFSNPPDRARSAKRWSAVLDFRSGVVGVRPARDVER